MSVKISIDIPVKTITKLVANMRPYEDLPHSTLNITVERDGDREINEGTLAVKEMVGVLNQIRYEIGKDCAFEERGLNFWDEQEEKQLCDNLRETYWQLGDWIVRLGGVPDE